MSSSLSVGHSSFLLPSAAAEEEETQEYQEEKEEERNKEWPTVVVVMMTMMLAQVFLPVDVVSCVFANLCLLSTCCAAASAICVVCTSRMIMSDSPSLAAVRIRDRGFGRES